MAAGDPVGAGAELVAGAGVLGAGDVAGVVWDVAGVGDGGGAVLCWVVAGADVLVAGAAEEVLGRDAGAEV